MAKWGFLLTDLAGVPHGEILQASERQVVLPLNRMPMASFTIPLWHTRATTIIDTDCLLQCWRRGADGVNRLAFHGPIISVEEVGQSLKQSIKVNAAGPFWRLTKRIIGVDPDGKASKAGWSLGVTTPADLAYIAEQILVDVNSRGYTGIGMGTREDVTDGSVGPWHAKNAGEAIAELTTGLNSFDFEITPLIPTSAAQGLQIGTLNIWAYKGVERPDSVFEYGTGKANVVEYKRQLTRDGMLTRAHILAPGWPDGTQQNAIVKDADTLAARGVFEDVISDLGITFDNFRNALLDEHLRVRKNPRSLIEFTPAMNARPEWGTDWLVGDSVRARAYVRGSRRFDAMVRIWGATFDVDEAGNEKATMEMMMP